MVLPVLGQSTWRASLLVSVHDNLIGRDSYGIQESVTLPSPYILLVIVCAYSGVYVLIIMFEFQVLF